MGPCSRSDDLQGTDKLTKIAAIVTRARLSYPDNVHDPVYDAKNKDDP